MFVRGSIETPSLLCSSFLGAGASNVWGEWGVLSPPTILGSAVWCWVQPPIHHNFAPELDRPAGQYERIPQVWHTAAGGYSTSHHGQHPWSPSLSSSLSLYLSLGRVRVPKRMNLQKTIFKAIPLSSLVNKKCQRPTSRVTAQRSVRGLAGFCPDVLVVKLYSRQSHYPPWLI